ncbi:molybdenum ABC transporter ATP-binding protein [Rhodobacter ferrooxidans]|uniref:Molybdate ABC transporter, ATPase subunit n=1 Tax=Rhodobacter ferrooxidans TaxID=371731 RepID=C8S186_9RHOB|nr:molybdenum ABC transporter ATP-binding protein [Rhodobacter sp. SW2]EEW25284.1 molybdate ABC transporter, ATPase subunit [Rhodobacter sp. SW2]
MTGVLRVDVKLQLGAFALDVAQDFALSGVTALFGRSGSGKSTLLRVIAGLEGRAAGDVVMAGQVWQGAAWIPPERRGIGYVFQDARFFPHLSVRGNLEFAHARARGLGGPGLDEVATALDLGPLLDRRPAALSGGEKQRVAIGRALLTAPRILLLDEPLAALDEARKAEILPYIERLRDQAGVPILYVSHSVAEVARLAQQVVVLQDGRVLRAGGVQEVLADPQAVPFLGPREAGALLGAVVAAQDSDGLTRLETGAGPLWVARIGAAIGSRLQLRIHAQDVILSRSRPEGLSALNILPATVTAVQLEDDHGATVQLRAGDDLLLARLTRRSVAALELAPGVAVYAVVKSVAVAQGDVAGAQPR